MTVAASPTTRSVTTTSRKALSVTLWALQLLLACFFVMVGYSHALMPFDQIAQQATWMNDVPRRLSLFIGYAEIAGGLGLIIPAATRLAPLADATGRPRVGNHHDPGDSVPRIQRRGQRHLDARADCRAGGLRRVGTMA